MSMKRIIKCFNEFVLDEQIYFFEQREVGGVIKSRKLSPMFVFENWEVYALPMSGGLLYAIVGLHEGKRVFYDNICRTSRTVRYFYSAGRDLICENSVLGDVLLLSPKNGVLENIAPTLKKSELPSTYVSCLKYKEGVLEVFLQAPRFYNGRKFFLQTETGYEEIDGCEVECRRKNFVPFLQHPSFE